MKKVAAIGAGVIALALVGGGVAIATNADLPDDEVSISAEATPIPSQETPPLTASEPEQPDESDSDADAAFLDYVRTELALLPSTGIADATDEQLIAAGHDGCEQLRGGVDPETIRLVEGEEPAASGYYMDTATIVGGAMRAYCPDTIF